mmetsp:Transcript_41492/g.63328  ORF Transcript_41492/g.63328 Transcript_41492/m.63328 type:complete len:109 (+) Transcript_41492:569-895(+)
MLPHKKVVLQNSNKKTMRQSLNNDGSVVYTESNPTETRNTQPAQTMSMPNQDGLNDTDRIKRSNHRHSASQDKTTDDSAPEGVFPHMMNSAYAGTTASKTYSSIAAGA